MLLLLAELFGWMDCLKYQRFSCEHKVFSSPFVGKIQVIRNFLGLVLLRNFEPYLDYTRVVARSLGSVILRNAVLC